MEKLRDAIEKSRRYLKKAVQLPHEEDYDEDFREILKLFHYCGYLNPERSKKRWNFAFVWLTYLTGCLKETILQIAYGDIYNVLLGSIMLTMIITASKSIWMFLDKQTEIIDLMKSLQKLHKPKNKEDMEAFTVQISRMVKIYKASNLFSTICLCILSAFGFGYFELIIPVIYDVLAKGFMWRVLFCINAIHSCFASFSYVPTELLHILCIARIEKNLKFLAEDFRNCTVYDDESPKEEKLAACVNYHCEILR